MIDDDARFDRWMKDFDAKRRQEEARMSRGAPAAPPGSSPDPETDKEARLREMGMVHG